MSWMGPLAHALPHALIAPIEPGSWGRRRPQGRYVLPPSTRNLARPVSGLASGRIPSGIAFPRLAGAVAPVQTDGG
jgi:hypothetical protein